MANATETTIQQPPAAPPPFGIAQILTLGLPILTGVVGYFIAYWNNLNLEKKKGELKFVSDQIQYLYGPLFALNAAGAMAVDALLKRKGKTKFFFEPGEQYDEGNIKEYRLWMIEVFMPINIRIENIITENAHLIKGASMPRPFGDMLAHVAAYKAVMKGWPDNPPIGKIDYEVAAKENTGLLPFPQALPSYVEATFNQLKQHQADLLGLVGQLTIADGAQVRTASGSLPSSFDFQMPSTQSSTAHIP